MPRPIEVNADTVDLSARLKTSTTVVGSPAAAAETIICQTAAIGDVAVISGCVIFGFAAFTVGTSGTASTLRIRQTNVGGTLIASTGALTTAAAALFSPNILGFDAAAVAPGQVYVLTLQVTAGAATSTVSGTQLTVLTV